MKKLTLLIAMLLFLAFNYSAQAVESHTIACTAGNLATLTAGYKATVTNLTVTGTIDARDFKTMRDDMISLAVLDLGEVTIAAYSGAEGTVIGSTNYPINEIPQYAFYNKSQGKAGFNTIIFPSSIISIGAFAFEECHDLSGTLLLPASLKVIGAYAFAYCSGLTGDLTIPSAVTKIDNIAFWGCNGCTGTLTIPASVTYIGAYSFTDCALTTIISHSVSPVNLISQPGVFGINKTTCILHVPIGSKSSYANADQWKDFISIVDDISDLSKTAVCTAGNLATVAASYLSTVTNLTVTGTIDARDFKTMRDAMPLLEVIDLSGSTVSAYTGTEGTSGTVSTVYPANGIPDYAFYRQLTFASKKSLKSFKHPSSLMTIGVGAFYSCSGLIGSLTIPSSVTIIMDWAYGYCINFTGLLTIPTSVTVIGYHAFDTCVGFTGSLTVPSSVTIIGNYAFNKCFGITGSLTIPSVTTIDSYAFSDCRGLTSIYAYATSPIDIRGSTNVFSGVDKTIPLHVPVGSMAKYTAADQWQDFTNIVEDIPNSIDEVLNSSISIFPNPATTHITVSELSSLVSDKTVTLSVTDVSGRTLFSQYIEPSLNTLTIDVSTFNCGIYFIAIQTSKGSVIKRFVKE